MASDVSLICDAGLFMFQSRSPWQFIWWTHKKAKYSPVTHFWESEAHVSPVSIFTVASLRLSVSWHQAALCRSRQLSEPGETQSVSARSAWCITASHVSRDPSRVTKFWVLTCDCCEVWLKLSQVVINLSLWVWQEEFANKTFPHLSRESTSNIEKQLQCVSVTLITSCERDGRVSGVIFISDGSLWLLYNINTHYIGAQEREKTPVRFIIHSKIGISGGDNDW